MCRAIKLERDSARGRFIRDGDIAGEVHANCFAENHAKADVYRLIRVLQSIISRKLDALCECCLLLIKERNANELYERQLSPTKAKHVNKIFLPLKRKKCFLTNIADIMERQKSKKRMGGCTNNRIFSKCGIMAVLVGGVGWQRSGESPSLRLAGK